MTPSLQKKLLLSSSTMGKLPHPPRRLPQPPPTTPPCVACHLQWKLSDGIMWTQETKERELTKYSTGLECVRPDSPVMMRHELFSVRLFWFSDGASQAR